MGLDERIEHGMADYERLVRKLNGEDPQIEMDVDEDDD